ncbi:MAG: YdeI/OmpD-associated family protein [Candidatus Cloacimonetes bacterium]|nr:YdeI/OmpD-associated family protein [Candidatus Cloacimonadota bacterium]
MTKQLHCSNVDDWRNWLQENHTKENEIWLIFFKKGTEKSLLDYESAVEEALCFGWIDSIIKKIDDMKYARKFTPRKDRSRWSELNKQRVARLIKNHRMTAIGLAKVETAKKNGSWDNKSRADLCFDIPDDFKSALHDNKKAVKNFKRLSCSYQKQYIGWIVAAKRQDTRARRIGEAVALLERGEKLGMK